MNKPQLKLPEHVLLPLSPNARKRAFSTQCVKSCFNYRIVRASLIKFLEKTLFVENVDFFYIFILR